MPTPLIQRVFSFGELSPELYARADLVQYASGLRTCRNFFPRKSGGVSNRAGFRFCGEAGEMGAQVFLYRWSFTAASQSTLIEAGDLYFRFWQGGARVTVTIAALSAYAGGTTYEQGDLVKDGGIAYYAMRETVGDTPASSPLDWHPLETLGAEAIYEIPTPYDAGAFNSPGPLHFAQSGAIITICHPGYAPMELQNLDVLGATPAWVLVPVTTDPAIEAPANLAGTPSAGTATLAYKVTAVKEETYEESLPSAVETVINALPPTEADPVALTWDPVTGAVEYRVYLDKHGNGTFGYIGTATEQETFNDVGYAPDYEVTPPIQRTLFAAANDYPTVSTFYQQRRVFGYTGNQPATVFASRTGFRSNFSISSPLQDDDAITFTLASNDFDVIRHLIALKRLITLTESGGYVVRGDDSGVLTPSGMNLDLEEYHGASIAFPAVFGGNILYVQARQKIVRELRFTSDVALVESRDVTLFSSHLFEENKILRLEAQREAHPIIWAVRDDGVLLSMTYVPEFDQYGWARHDTGATGIIEDICIVPEDGEDVLYAVINRQINGNEVRYIERLASRVITAATFNEDCFFVDAGITYDGAPITVITGLDHLEGEVVAVVGDGAVIFDGDPTDPDAADFTVSGGAITIPAAKSVVHVGLAIRYAEIETLTPDVAGNSIRDRRKLITSLGAVLDRSTQSFLAGPDDDNLVANALEPWETVTAPVSKRVEVPITSRWDEDGRIFIRHDQPMPLTILAVIPSVQAGG